MDPAPEHWLKVLTFIDADPGSFRPWLDPGGTEKDGIRDKHPGSATLLLDMKIYSSVHFIALQTVQDLQITKNSTEEIHAILL